MLADGDRVAIRETMGGTHRGEWKDSPVGPLAPTGKQVTVTANVMYRIANNRIVQDVGEVDILGLLQQLGAIPAPGQAREAGA
jgi:predicted ester cyclase